jgi:hypothetical protein
MASSALPSSRSFPAAVARAKSLRTGTGWAKLARHTLALSSPPPLSIVVLSEAKDLLLSCLRLAKPDQTQEAGYVGSEHLSAHSRARL